MAEKKIKVDNWIFDGNYIKLSGEFEGRTIFSMDKYSLTRDSYGDETGLYNLPLDIVFQSHLTLGDILSFNKIFLLVIQELNLGEISDTTWEKTINRQMELWEHYRLKNINEPVNNNINLKDIIDRINLYKQNNIKK